MCSTCGCSDEAHITITDVKAPRELRDYDPTRAHHHSGDQHRHGDHDHDLHVQADQHSKPDQSSSGGRLIRLEHDLLEKNNRLAERNRLWFEGREICAVNLMSSPGAGKTTLLERTIGELGAEYQISVIEGDQATTRDAERIDAAGCRVIQVNTGNGCHLDSAMVAEALRKLDPPAHSLVMIENVGNLVCPALFDLGERKKVVIMSVTEGEDKPLKYPHMFRAADLMILNKVDLLPHISFSVEHCIDYARKVKPLIKIIATSATKETGLDEWCSWLRTEISKL
ncbi:MAG TPA: hydrogenase nickel incorporation protein HypB [Candidatus Binataceae bacterium]|nr:hydrogenase nickel incorporation protein HypB [Candidatus Binataceae bacterium]